MKFCRTLAALILLSGCASQYADPLPTDAERHRTRTRDGYSLSLVRYVPENGRQGRPVLLVHGIAANDRNMDLDSEHSLARFLKAHGREAWTLSLRGAGSSDLPDPKAGRADFDLDSYAREDFPAAIDYIKKVTGTDAVDLIGHSMGGLVTYAYLSQGGRDVGAAVALGAPTRLDWGSPILQRLSMFRDTFVSRKFTVPVVAAAHLVMPLHGELSFDPVQLLIANPQNVELRTWKRLIAYGIANIEGGVAEQFTDFIESGSFRSYNKQIDYRKDMKRITTPMLVVAGKADRLAPPMAVRDGYRALGGEKEWLLLAAERGTRFDYSHMDMVMGDRASTELWPKVLDFLDRHGPLLSADSSAPSTSTTP